VAMCVVQFLQPA